jgi:hypothetical protein
LYLNELYYKCGLSDIVLLDGKVHRTPQEGDDPGVLIMHYGGTAKNAARRAWAAFNSGILSDLSKAYEYNWRQASFSFTRGVILGADQAQEWMLEWWWENYDAHNTLPVCFVDFGMTKGALDWCRHHGTVTDPIHFGGYAWFKKPLATLETVFAKTIWLDIDCQVLGNLDPLFEYCKSNGIGMTVDRGTPDRYKQRLPPEATIYNSGCIVYNFRDPVMPQWAKMTAIVYEQQPGDQETLALTLRRYAVGRIRSIPKELVRLRLEEDGPCIVRHWTGPVGKDRIRAMSVQAELR